MAKNEANDIEMETDGRLPIGGWINLLPRK